MRSASESNFIRSRDGRGRKRSIAFILIGFIALVALIYALARRDGEVPRLPRPRFMATEVEGAMRQLAERASSMSLTDDERELVNMFERLNLAEAGAPADVNGFVHVQGLIKAMEEIAAAHAADNRERYLRLGDILALEFDRQLNVVLEEASDRGLSAALKTTTGRELDARAGSFVRRSVECGLVDERGKLAAPALLPQVLFRIRWRALAGIDRREDITPVDWRAYLDFALTFSKPGSVEARLEAIDELEQIQTGFDGLLARAVVLYEGGRTDDAYALLSDAIESGRDDEQLADFVRFLAP